MNPDCHPTAFTDGAKGSLRLLAVERLALFAILAVICLLAVAGVTVALAQDSTGRRFVAAAVIAAVFGGAVCVVLMVDSVRRPPVPRVADGFGQWRPPEDWALFSLPLTVCTKRSSSA